MLKVTCDTSSNQKVLRRLEIDGHIELWAVNIEQHRQPTKRLKKERKEPPIGIYGSAHSTWGNSVYASDENIYGQLLAIVGHHNQADAMHLEAHYRSGRDVFVSEDKDDILSKREELLALGIEVMSPDELARKFRSV